MTKATEARADGSPEARRLLTGIRALVRRFAISERADVACCGTTVAQSAILETLGTLGAIRLGTLSRRLGVSPSTLTRTLLRLEGRRLVARATDRDDARSFRVRLTAAGRRAADRIGRRNEAFAGLVLGRLGPGQRRAVMRSLHHLLSAVRCATESCCPGAFDHLMQDFPRAQARARRSVP